MKLTRTDLIFVNGFKKLGIWRKSAHWYAIVDPIMGTVLIDNIESFNHAHEIIIKIKDFVVQNPQCSIESNILKILI